MIKKHEHVIKSIIPGSIADELGIEPGDILLSVNGEPVTDVFDYRFRIKDEELTILIRKSGEYEEQDEEWEIDIEKDEDDDLGLEFENDLMSSYRSCTNKCIFCFIDQMPPGMRDTLYFKDDDSRLSFLQGNYITLTNMSDEDIDRIIMMGLAPINISVHTTDPELRCRMLGNRFAGEKLKYLDRLYDGGVEMNGQIVLCRDINDGDRLEKTIGDLSKYLPYLRSVSVVPSGLTKYREGLYPLRLFDAESAKEVIDIVERWQDELYEKWGLHFIHASDEWYYLAGLPMPEEERYDGYLQLENGVGMTRLFMEEAGQELERLSSDKSRQFKNAGRSISVATGVLAGPVIEEYARKVTEAFPDIRVRVHAIRNEFFGESITVTGLITGQDLIKQLKEKQDKGTDLGDVILIPTNMLRSNEEVFLDDLKVSDVISELKTDVRIINSSGEDFVRAIVDAEYVRRHDNDEDSFVYVKEYGQ